jgi:hypothetical protein
MEKSIDLILPNLLKDNEKLNIVADYLFDLLESRSLFQGSEYLALRLLNDKNCTLENNFARQLETYRAMKKGNIAPDIVFEKDHFNSPANAIASENVPISTMILSGLISDIFIRKNTGDVFESVTVCTGFDDSHQGHVRPGLGGDAKIVTKGGEIDFCPCAWR